MRVFISSHALSQLKPGMKIHGVIREEENTAHICAPEMTHDRSVIGQVLHRGEAIPTPPQSPWLFVFAHSSQPKVFIWSQNHLSLTQVEVIEDHDVFARTPFDPACLKTLQHSTVTIFGCGTGGSYLALELARAGVGNFILIDPDTMEASNLSRHEGGFSDLGRNKVSVVKDRIMDIHPNAQVQCYPRDIFQDDSDTFMYDLFTQSSLVIASTDILAVQLMVNEWAVNHRTPAVFGGCYENAIGGEVFAYVPEWETPCLCCLKGGGVVVQQKRGPIDYSTATGRDDYEGQPGLHAAVNFVSSLEAQIALGVLLRNHNDAYAQIVNPDRCFWFVGGAFCKGHDPFQKPFDIFPTRFVGPRSNCDICQNKRNPEYSEPAMLCDEIPDDDPECIWDSLKPHETVF